MATYNAAEGSFQGSTWYRLGSGHELTLVGYWYALVSLPIFQFLIFRWIYRMMVWSSFLWKISRPENSTACPERTDGSLKRGSARPSAILPTQPHL